MDRDRIFALLLLILVLQGVLLLVHPNIQGLYTRLQDIQKELRKSKGTPTLRTGVVLESTNSTASPLLRNAKLLLVYYHRDQGAEALLMSRPGLYRSGYYELVKFGGPVDMDKRFYLHDNKRVENSSRVVDGVYFGGEVRHSEEINTRILTFSGIARWEAGELEAEVKAGEWRIGPVVRAEAVFAEL